MNLRTKESFARIICPSWLLQSSLSLTRPAEPAAPSSPRFRRSGRKPQSTASAPRRASFPIGPIACRSVPIRLSHASCHLFGFLAWPLSILSFLAPCRFVAVVRPALAPRRGVLMLTVGRRRRCWRCPRGSSTWRSTARMTRFAAPPSRSARMPRVSEHQARWPLRPRRRLRALPVPNAGWLTRPHQDLHVM